MRAVVLHTSRPPALAAVERLLVQATREVQLLGALTPLDPRRERARLTEAVCARRPAAPRWSYAPVAHDAMRRALDAAELALAKTAATPMDHLYLGRVRELALEAALCAAAGTAEVGPLARQRFAPVDPDGPRAASALCASWLAEACESRSQLSREQLVASDADDPRSLLSRMRATVGRLRLPFRVVAHTTLAPLAATGDGCILVATGRLLREEDTLRTVVHEIEGHALPRARAAGASLPLFGTGTARGTDEQEGRALLLEERAGLLNSRRRRQLAARHRCVEAMLEGATFDDATRALVDAHGLDPADAVVVAERVFRGGDGTRPGLGRERVYLASFVRVRAHLARFPGDEEVLASGQVAIEAIEVLRPHTPVD